MPKQPLERSVAYALLALAVLVWFGQLDRIQSSPYYRMLGFVLIVVGTIEYAKSRKGARK